MTSTQYLKLRNRLMTQACFINIYSKEYANLQKRIQIINNKIMTQKELGK